MGTVEKRVQILISTYRLTQAQDWGLRPPTNPHWYLLFSVIETGRCASNLALFPASFSGYNSRGHRMKLGTRLPVA